MENDPYMGAGISGTGEHVGPTSSENYLLDAILPPKRKSVAEDERHITAAALTRVLGAAPMAKSARTMHSGSALFANCL